jgi:hypothetical protein
MVEVMIDDRAFKKAFDQFNRTWAVVEHNSEEAPLRDAIEAYLAAMPTVYDTAEQPDPSPCARPQAVNTEVNQQPDEETYEAVFEIVSRWQGWLAALTPAWNPSEPEREYIGDGVAGGAAISETTAPAGSMKEPSAPSAGSSSPLPQSTDAVNSEKPRRG